MAWGEALPAAGQHSLAEVQLWVVWWWVSFVLALFSPSRLCPSHVPCLSLQFRSMGQCSITVAYREPRGRNELLHLHWLCHRFCPHPSSCLGSLLCFWSQLFIINWRTELENV